MKNLFAYITRTLYFLPGTYYLYKFFNLLFPQPDKPTHVIMKTPSNFKIEIDLSKYQGNKIFWRGAHDWSTIFAMKKIIDPQKNVIDIGANIGEYTLFAASFISPNNKVWAFEPVQKMYSTLIKNIQLNPHLQDKIIPIKIGLSNQSSIVPIFDENNTSNEGLFSIHSKNFSHPQKIEDIELNTLDNAVIQHQISNIGFIKIDVEGNELFVLQGAKETIQKYKPFLMIECSEKNFNAAGYTAQTLLEYLNQFNYKFFLIKKRGQLEKINSIHEIPEFCNIIASPPSSS